MKRFSLIVCLLPLALGASLDYKGFPDVGSDSGYTSEPAPEPATDSGSGSSFDKTDAYGNPTRCSVYYDTVFTQKCEPYTDKICRTTHSESCQDVPDQFCKAVKTNKQARKCFEVTELYCKLKEDVAFKMVDVPFTVQKCKKVVEPVCDTIYESTTKSAPERHCIDVTNPVCSMSERTLTDKTCVTKTEFNCDNYDYDYPTSGYGNGGGDYSATSGYGYGQSSKCRRSTSTKCYDTPRTVQVQQCGRKTETVCDTVNEIVPQLQDKKHCHDEERKECFLEQRTQQKQVKEFVYSTQCSKVPRTVCESADVKNLVASCAPSTRKECSYSAHDNCEDVSKKHCYQVAQKVKKEKCEPASFDTPKYEQPSFDAPSGYTHE